jgi:hypothetical protein
VSASFYEPLDDAGRRWRATAHTTGPWDPRSQHGGPPSALLARAVERTAPRDDVVVARVTVEILGAVPVGELEVAARVVRPGRSVELVEAVLTAGGRDVARAAAWRVRRTEGTSVPPRSAAPPLPAAGTEEVLPDGWVDGYLSAVEWRLARGGFAAPGPCTAWTRLRHPLVPDEEPSGLQRVLAVADSGNGLSNELPMSWWFINPELTVHLVREPVGEWVCVDAVTTVADGGCGLATTALSDLDGPVGVGAQSLLVAPRG